MSCLSSIQHWDLNPQPLEHEPPPITTRPWLPPSIEIFAAEICDRKSTQWRQCDQIGRINALQETFQRRWQQLFCPNSHICKQFLWRCRNLSFLQDNHFWATFIDICQLFLVTLTVEGTNKNIKLLFANLFYLFDYSGPRPVYTNLNQASKAVIIFAGRIYFGPTSTRYLSLCELVFFCVFSLNLYLAPVNSITKICTDQLLFLPYYNTLLLYLLMLHNIPNVTKLDVII